MQKEVFETQLDRSASEGQVSQREHLLSEENQEEVSRFLTWNTSFLKKFKRRKSAVLRGSQGACLGCCNSLVSVNYI
jgi:hypothetical protein